MGDAASDTLGKVCDQAAMKAEVLAELRGGFEWPDIDLSDLFGWFD